MITALVAAIALQIPAAQQAPSTDAKTATTASDLISNMFAHYMNAQNVLGTIHMTQEAKGTSISTDTELQFTRPNKIYLKQIERSSEGRLFLLTSDGRSFSYDKPKGHFGPNRYVEYTKNQYKLLDLGDIYTATLDSIVDPSHMLNVAIGRKSDLATLASQLSSFRITSSAKEGADTLYQITGKYRLTPKAEASSDFLMELTGSGDFRRFITRQAYSVPQHPEMAPVTVTTTWVSTLKVDGNIDPSLFRVVPPDPAQSKGH